MEVVARSAFNRDVDLIKDDDLKEALAKKIFQIIKAKDISHTTGIKLLRGYTTHYRIKIQTGKHSYRIGAVVRGNKIWLARFLPRVKIYKQFP